MNGPQNTARRSKTLWIAIVVVAVIAGVVAWQRTSSHPSPAPTTVAAAPPHDSDVVSVDDKQLLQISTEPVKQTKIAVDRNATGQISFNEDRLTPVFTPYAGRVLELLANKGDQVKEGQPLVVIESSDFVAAQNDLASARSDVAKADIGLKTAQGLADRAHRLFDQEAVAAKDVQQADADLARAKDEVRRAGTALASVENRLTLFGKNPQEIAQLGDHVDRQVVLRAPIAGTIVDRKIGPGQYVKPDAPDPLFLISDLSTLWVLANVYESDSAVIPLNTPLEVTVAAYPNRVFPARVSFISPTVDPATRTVRVRCIVQNPGGLLKPEMFATVKIGSAQEQTVTFVPASAVVVEGNTAVAFVVDSPGHFRRRLIKIGQEMTGGFAVLEGLRPGELVATRGALLLNEMSKSNQ